MSYSAYVQRTVTNTAVLSPHPIYLKSTVFHTIMSDGDVLAQSAHLGNLDRYVFIHVHWNLTTPRLLCLLGVVPSFSRLNRSRLVTVLRWPFWTLALSTPI